MKLIKEGLTFDDVLLLPNHSEVLARDVTLTTHLTPTIVLKNPLLEVAAALKGKPISIIADGGVCYSGDLCKALAAGAHAVMIGSLFTGTEETPGEIELYRGQPYKAYRGMGSLGAMQQGSSDRYSQDNIEANKLAPEEVEGRIPYKRPLQTFIRHLLGGIRAGVGYTGSANITELHKKAQLIKLTAVGICESHVHNVSITKGAPNYTHCT